VPGVFIYLSYVSPAMMALMIAWVELLESTGDVRNPHTASDEFRLCLLIFRGQSSVQFLTQPGNQAILAVFWEAELVRCASIARFSRPPDPGLCSFLLFQCRLGHLGEVLEDFFTAYFSFDLKSL